MPLFAKHSVPALPCKNSCTSPDSQKKMLRHKFTLKKIRVKNNQSSPNNKSKVSIFRLSRSKCKTGNTSLVKLQVQPQAMPTDGLSPVVSSIRPHLESPADLTQEPVRSDRCPTEDGCICLLEDSYHPDKVHKKHWYSIKKNQSCKGLCSKRDDKKCGRSSKRLKGSFTPITRQFRRFLHKNTDNGIHYFFESKDCECYKSTESFESIFGVNNTVCQTCSPENNLLRIFSTPPNSIFGAICPSDTCCSPDTTVVMVDTLSNCCVSVGSVFDCEVQECSSTLPALPCEGIDCFSSANVIVAHETQQCSSTGSCVTYDAQECSSSVSLVLSCGAQDCSTLSSALTCEVQECSSYVDLVLACDLEQCTPICSALESTRPALVLVGNKPGLCSPEVSDPPCKEEGCGPESLLLVNTSDSCCYSEANLYVEDRQRGGQVLLNSEFVSKSTLTPKSISPISLSSKELVNRPDETNHSNDEHDSSEEHEQHSFSSVEQECCSPDNGFLTGSVKCGIANRKLFHPILEECF